MPPRRSGPSPTSRICPLICGLTLLTTSATAGPAPGPAPEPPAVDVRPLAPDRLPTLPYWPFTPVDDPSPALDAIPIDAPLDPGGCGGLTWDRHPVSGATAPGPFCVALLDGDPPLLVVGRPGEDPYVLVPARVGLVADGDTHTVTVQAPRIALPGVTAAVRRWAAAPEGAR